MPRNIPTKHHKPKTKKNMFMEGKGTHLQRTNNKLTMDFSIEKKRGRKGGRRRGNDGLRQPRTRKLHL